MIEKLGLHPRLRTGGFVKKTSMKKLVLAKETLRSLDDSNLQRAAGGTTERCGSGNIGCEITKLLEILSLMC